MVRVELLMGEMTARMHACTLNPQLSSDPTMRGRRRQTYHDLLSVLKRFRPDHEGTAIK